MCAPAISETLMTFGSGYGSAVSTMLPVSLRLDNAQEKEIEVQILESTADGDVTLYMGNDTSNAAVFLRLPALASNEVQRPARRLNPRTQLYINAGIASSGRCTILIRTFGSKCGGGCF